MKVIVAEDDPVTLLLISEQLTGWGYDVLTAENGVEVLTLVEDNPDVMLFLLDWQMPEMDGIELCQELKSNHLVDSCYIIILTGNDRTENLVTALESGADDFISKPFLPDELRVRLKVGQRVVDIEARLLHQSRHDPLTNIPNHRYIMSEIEKQWQRTTRDHSDLSVMMLDIDHFKKINDTYGHQAGDFALKQFTKMVASEIRPYDLLGRYGGEEFTVCCPSSDAKQAMKIAERIRQRVYSTPLVYDGLNFSLTVSIGVTSHSDHYSSHSEMLLFADKAAYQAKGEGRNRVVFIDKMTGQP